MNCKPNDYAFIVKTRPQLTHLRGRVIKVLALHPAHSMAAWTFEPRLCNEWGGPIEAAEDECLRPIRPGETLEESTEAMKRLHETTVPAKKKEPVVRPYQWEEL